MEMIFYSHANKLTHFHKKGFALSLTVKLRVFGTRKRPNKNCVPQYFPMIHFVVSILRIKILLFLKLFGTFFMICVIC